MDTDRFKGLLALLSTSLLWGSSFPAIKIVITSMSEYTYTWMRSLIAALGLTPYLIYYIHRYGSVSRSAIRGGLTAGVAYALGLWLQGWGTRYTTASNSAFITGLNIIFVHLYRAVVKKSYSSHLGLSLIFAIAGLYMITEPNRGFNVGDILVLFGSAMWAAQLILVDKYCRENPVIFTLFEMLPAFSFIIPDLLTFPFKSFRFNSLLLVVYLALICGDGAFTLQVFGQKYVEAGAAAIILLSEPVFASILAHLLISEFMTLSQMVGASLIVAAMLIVSFKS
ncbi:MAG: DMT family transporter [archaeon GB-1845-036]|nr:DMT family transporter [Candidatus Culexmicrobium thermophilum]